MRGAGWAGVLALSASGCALLSRGQPFAVRYYDPQPPSTSVDQAPPWPACELSMGRIAGTDGVRQQIMRRDAMEHVEYDEGRRWTEPPDSYLRRALDRVLFEEGRCHRTFAAGSPILDATLVAFEGIEAHDAPASARVGVQIVVHDEREVFDERTIVVDRDVPPGGDADAYDRLVRAMSVALLDLATQIAERVNLVLSARRPSADRRAP
jgi:cholesterol transport system auxiliary component